VCAYCRSVVARGDRKPEDLGKVAALIDTDSPLEVGVQGKYRGMRFHITGRAQLGHPAGGVWDEWYVAFPNEQWGWLAEAQGRFYLTFAEQSTPVPLPAFAQLDVGDSVQVRRGFSMVIAEKGTAKRLSAEGEIPYLLTPGEKVNYADLSGPGGSFATLDYSEEKPQVYFGTQVTLDDLGIPKTAKKRSPGREIAGKQLSCPNCGGALELRAPDKTERVTCPSCASLLDVNQGELRFLMTLEATNQPFIPLGSVGTLSEGPLTVVGLLERCVTFDGVNYYWEEYLLYEPSLGFRWLVRSDNHWSYVKPVPPGDVDGRGKNRTYQGKTFKIFQKADASVTCVLGEFYWKVSVGEVVQATDYIHPPEMLSREVSTLQLQATYGPDGIASVLSADASEEINWSHGTYLTPAEVQQAFGLPRMPSPRGVAPNQPFLFKRIYITWAWLLLVACLLATVFIVLSSNRVVYQRNFALERRTSVDQPAQVFFSDPATPVELTGWKNIQVTVEAPVNNSWLAVEGDFIDDETGLVQTFMVPVEYYHGVEDGESWSEGGITNYTMLSALPKGKYTLMLAVTADPQGQPASFNVVIRQGVPRLLHVFLLILGLSALPLAVLLYHWSFEHSRWKDSDYSPFSSS
ncbi:MAG: DUF4178 domain-containing protein, partial [Planctomycetia bacterium]|nr:DUF4178 domain-containing protein [Planctomycetia bacterium]